MKKQSHFLAWALLLVPFIWSLSNSMIIPILPRIQQELGISKVQAGLIISALSTPTAILLPLAGFLSDRYGRITIMIPAILLYGLGGLVAGLAGAINSYILLLIARGIQGIGATGTSLLAISLAGDLFQDPQHRTKVIGALESSNSIGKLISPVLGSAAALLFWYAPFFIYPILSLPIAILLFILRKGENKAQKYCTLRQYFQELYELLRKKFLLYLASFSCILIAVMIWFGTLFFLSEIMSERFQIQGITKGLLLSVPVFTLALTSFIASRYLTCGLAKRTYYGLGLISLTLLATIVLPDSFLLYVTVGLIGIGFGLVLPSMNTLISSSVDIKERGVITATYGSIRALGSAIGPVTVGALLVATNENMVLICTGTLALIATFICYFFVNEQELMN